MLSTYTYHQLPPAYFGVCYTIFRENIVLLAQKLYAPWKLAKSLFNICAFNLIKNDWQVAKFQFVFHSHIFRKQISNVDEVHTGRNRDLIGYISGQIEGHSVETVAVLQKWWLLFRTLDMLLGEYLKGTLFGF